MALWVMNGRIPGDDEDTMLLVMADDELSAECQFVHTLGGMRYANEQAIREAVEEHGESVILGGRIKLGEVRETTLILDPSIFDLL